MFGMGGSRRSQAFWTAVARLVAYSAVGCFLGCEPTVRPHARFGSFADAESRVTLSPEMARRVEAFCGDCHALPRPESFARDRWHFEVRRGYEFYAKSGRNDLAPPPLHETLAYYRARAPEQLTFARAEEAAEVDVRFQQEKLHLPVGSKVLPEIAYVRWARLARDEDPTLLASDIRHGQVVAIDLKLEGRLPPRVLAQIRNPGRIDVCDLNADGQTDLVVADLGSYLPSDHDRGRVVLLQRRPGTKDYDGVELVSGLGRVADVRAVDGDRDGKLDLIVAEFGWRESGRVLWGRNVSDTEDKLRFEWEEIDDRPGAIDIRIHDFTGDGQPDFAALFSQEYESVELFQNRWTDRHTSRQTPFVAHRLWSAPDLTFGSTGIELVDLNQDGLVDILYTNGDAFDNAYASPWHGVQWLENRENLKFVYHRLTDMPGAYRALPGDFDGDGKVDIVVVASLPPNVQPASVKASPLASIVLLRQTAPGNFARRTLEWGSPYYATLEVADLDSDGDLDFIVAPGPYVSEARQNRRESHYLTVWWNRAAPEN